MSQPLQIEELEARIAADPGAQGFATLAEAYRRLERLDDARRVAVAGLALHPDHTQGRLALGLTLLDLGEAAAAHYEIECAMGAVAGEELNSLTTGGDAAATFVGRPAHASEALEEGVADAELDAAFASAEAVSDAMLDANRIAEQAMRDGKLDTPEGFNVGGTPTFATETMARLLDDQGDARTADAIRGKMETVAGTGSVYDAALRVGKESPAPDGPGAIGMGTMPSSRVVATLESWLDNLQRSGA